MRTARLCGVAPGAPIGGCDPPHPASIAAATQLVSALRLKSKLLILPCSRLFRGYAHGHAGRVVRPTEQMRGPAGVRIAPKAYVAGFVPEKVVLRRKGVLGLRIAYAFPEPRQPNLFDWAVAT